MMLSMMAKVIDQGTGSRLRGEFGITGTLMGKTGTTQEQGDGWFIGFNWNFWKRRYIRYNWYFWNWWY
jgi:penicillin-binding protein 1A